MVSYTTNLKDWGAAGSEYPDSYNYVEGEQPVDEWDNFLTKNVIDDLQHLISLTNERIETDKGASGSEPGSPDTSHIYHDQGNDRLEMWDSDDSTWRGLMLRDGDTMTGPLTMDNYEIRDSSNRITLRDKTTIAGAKLDQEWHSKQEGGTISTGSIVPIGTFELDDGETLKITQAMLTEDGFTTPCVSGIDLVIATENDSSSSSVTVLSGDGSTHYPDETGSPLAQYENTSGSKLTVIIGLDNGHFNGGAGSDEPAFGGYVARVV